MKKLLLFSSLCCFSLALHAQSIPQTTPLPETAPRQAEPKPQVPKNNVKINLTALSATNISLQYERGLTRSTSVALGLGIMPSHGLPFSKNFKDLISDQAGSKTDLAVQDFLVRSRISGFSLTPEFRYYMGKKPQGGFYIAPYLRYSAYTLKWNYVFEDEFTGTPRPTTMKGKLNMVGGGLLFGAQWYVKNVSIDWWILGAAYNKNTLKVDAAVDLSDMPADRREELNRNIKEVEFNGYSADVTIKDNGVTGKGSIGMPALRVGLCIGYRF